MIWQHLLLVLLGHEHAIAMTTSSMQPSLALGQTVIAENVARSTALPVAQNDVIAFWNPSHTRLLVKRIIGMPGDCVQMQAGRLYLNGEIVPRRPRGSYSDTDENGIRIFVTRYVETLPNKARHLIYEAYDYWPLDNTPEFTVPAGSYFVMGDNRDRSIDSRVPEFGTVAAADIVARIPRRPVTLDLPW